MERTPSPTPDCPRLCTLTDGNAGNQRQVSALAAALAAPAAITDITLQARAPWRWLSPHRLPGAQLAFGDAFAQMQTPSLAIGCGRQAALATRLLRERGAKAVQILDPRLDPSHWDLVIAPEHDGLRGGNVIPLLGSLNPVDDDWLAAARTRFAHLAELPRPRTALLLGGDSAHWRFGMAVFESLASTLDTALARDGGSLLVTASRRTPAAIAEALPARLGHFASLIWRSERNGENPYPGLLAWADRIVCTPDSVNMVSEACATHAPVFVLEPQRIDGRPRRFLDALLARGRIRALDAQLTAFDAQPLRETARVAAVVRERLGI
ncbi:MAG: mitochondrial fission ELM1 family protein [Pseudoxanthomonas sp.]